MNYKLHARTVVNNPYNGDGYITKDGHTMFQADILRDLKRKEYLEERTVQLSQDLRAWLSLGIKQYAQCPTNLATTPTLTGLYETAMVCGVKSSRVDELIIENKRGAE